MFVLFMDMYKTHIFLLCINTQTLFKRLNKRGILDMHVTKIKQVVSVLTSNKETNKEQQSCLLGYVIGLEAPIGLNQQDPDHQVEWDSFFNDISGEINEHFLLNLALAQDVANLTLLYRQSVANGDDKIADYANKFLKLTGAAFGLLGNEGVVRQVRNVLKDEIEERRGVVEERIAQSETDDE